MKYNRHRVTMALALCSLLLVVARHAEAAPYNHRHVEVRSEHFFDKLVMRSELVVVMFYEKNKKELRHNRSLAHYIERLERLFTGISKVSRYKEAGIHFLAVNCSRDNLDAVADEYRIHQLPTFMLFADGAPVRKKDRGDREVALMGDVSSEQLRDFIEDNFGSRIDDIIADKAEARRIAAEQRALYGPYWGWGLGWGSPYYYWNYPFYGYPSGPWWY